MFSLSSPRQTFWILARTVLCCHIRSRSSKY
uniref:Uncharacterized protein n=1 Tax=Arundo donax TaxID=35708 RepID=A0A0A9EZ26_ARUDO